MPLFRRKPRDDAPVDLNERSPKSGLKYKDIELLGQMMKNGADLSRPRHVVYYLYLPSREAAETAAAEPRREGFACNVREPLPAHPGQWALICERSDAVLSLDYVRDVDNLFQGIADRLNGEFDGWEASVS